MRRSLHSAMLLLLGLVLGLVGAVVPLSAAHAVDGSVRGTVSEAGGGARLAGVEVVVYEYDVEYEEWFEVASDTTDASGAYQVLGVPPGTYRVGFHPTTEHGEVYYTNHAGIDSADDVVVGSGATVTLMEIMLRRTGQVTGRVTGPDTAPLAGIEVEAYAWTYGAGWVPAGSTATTGQDGRYELRRLSRTNYRLRFSDPAGHYLTEFWDNATSVETANTVFVYSGETTSGKDAQLAPAGSITGTVTGPAGPVPGASVTAYEYDAQWQEWSPVAWAETDEAGAYRLGGLPTGDYRLRFRDYDGGHLTEFWDDAASLSAATSIPVTAGLSVTGKDAVLTLGGRISGTVTGPGGTSLRHMDVTAYAWNAEWQWWDDVAYATTDAAGAYELIGLPTGTYRIAFDDYVFGTYASEYWDDQASIQTATPVAVTAGGTVTGRNAELDLAGAVTGTVTGIHPDDFVWVAAYQNVGGTWTYARGTYVEEDGTYRLGRLRAGTYRIGFEHDEGALQAEFWNDVATVEAATDVVVTAGGTASGRDATLAPAPGSAFRNISSPTVTGNPQVGHVLTATPGTWTPSTTSYSYQWLADGVATGATGATLPLTAGLQGRSISVRVTASGPGRNPAAAVSRATAPVAAAPVAPAPAPIPVPQPSADPAEELAEILAAVKVTGKAKVGRTLRVKNLVSGARYKVQWYVGKKAIAKATKAKLVLTRALVGKVVSVKVRATSDGVSRIRKVKVGRVRG